jgi:hypothetical protein
MKRWLCVLGVASVSVASETQTLHWRQPEDLAAPYMLEQVRAWHEAWANHWPWGQQELALRLRDDGSEQLLLMISGHARGGEYVLFLQQAKRWQPNPQLIELAHQPVQILPAQSDGWHEFETYVPAWGSGSAEVWVFRYRWNGLNYEQAEQRDATWCELRYFRETAADLCAAQ